MRWRKSEVVRGSTLTGSHWVGSIAVGSIAAGLAIVACAGEATTGGEDSVVGSSDANAGAMASPTGNTAAAGSTAATGSGGTSSVVPVGTSGGAATTSTAASTTSEGSAGGTSLDTAASDAASASGAAGMSGSTGTSGAMGVAGATGATDILVAAGGSTNVAGGGSDDAAMGGAGVGGTTALAGAGGQGQAGAPAAVNTSGCGIAAGQATGQWVQEPNVAVQGTAREWFSWLPDNYDPSRAYPLVVLFHGCSAADNNVPIQNASGDDAILVRGTGIQDNVCWDPSADGPNLEFFDAMVDGIGTKSCVDQNRIFAVGYSSGSWLISVLNCLRADRLRAVATIAGGNALRGNAECTGNVAAFFLHDQDDMNNVWANHEPTRDRLIEANGCSPDDPLAEDPEPCVRYQGCGNNPIKWCPTTGNGHGRQDQFAPEAFWSFFSEF